VASTSLLLPDDPFRERVRALLAGTEPFASPKEDRALGTMLGMAIGDAIGARCEFMPVRYGVKRLHDMGTSVGGSYQLKPGQWTDDSSMGLCVADSLLACAGAMGDPPSPRLHASLPRVVGTEATTTTPSGLTPSVAGSTAWG